MKKTTIILILLVFLNITNAFAIVLHIKNDVKNNNSILIVKSDEIYLSGLEPNFLDTIKLDKENINYDLRISKEGNYYFYYEGKQNANLESYLISSDTLKLQIKENENEISLEINQTKFRETLCIQKMNKEESQKNQYNELISKLKSSNSFQFSDSLIKDYITSKENFYKKYFANYLPTENFTKHFNTNKFYLSVYLKWTYLTNLINQNMEKITFYKSLCNSIDSASSIYFDGILCYAFPLRMLNDIDKVYIKELSETKNNYSKLQRKLNYCDIFFKNKEFNQLAKAKLLEDYLLLENDTSETKLINEKMLDDCFNSTSKYLKALKYLLNKKSRLEINQIPPDFSLTNQKNELINLYNFKGKDIYLSFSGSWCGPCQLELKNLKQINKKYNLKNNKDKIIIMIFIENDFENWEKYVAKLPKNFICLYAKNGWNSKVANDYLIKGVPITYLLNKNLQIINKIVGYDENEFAKFIQQYLNDKSNK